MRKAICLLTAIILCAALVTPAFAFQYEFVPSITYKPTPGLGEATLVIPMPPKDTTPDGETTDAPGSHGPDDLRGDKEEIHIGGCIVITSVTQAEEKSTDIAQEDRDLLLEMYSLLHGNSGDLFAITEEYFASKQTEPEHIHATGESGTPEEQEPGAHGKPEKPESPDAPDTPGAPAATEEALGLSYENKNYVVIQLVDVSFSKAQCVDDDHGHAETLEREDVNATLAFDLGVSADAVVLVLHLHDGKWEPVSSAVNNGDGTVTCVFEHFCPVAFCVEKEILEEPQQAAADYSWLLWLVVLVACAVTVAVLVIYREKDKKKRDHTKV